MKHSRRKACAQYQEFKIRKEDEELIKKCMEDEDTTLASRSNLTSVELGLMAEMMEGIKREYDVKMDELNEKKRKIRGLVLETVRNKNKSINCAEKIGKVDPLTPSKGKKSKKSLVGKAKKPNSKSKSMKDAEVLVIPFTLRSNKKSVRGV